MEKEKSTKFEANFSAELAINVTLIIAFIWYRICSENLYKQDVHWESEHLICLREPNYNLSCFN